MENELLTYQHSVRELPEYPEPETILPFLKSIVAEIESLQDDFVALDISEGSAPFELGTKFRIYAQRVKTKEDIKEELLRQIESTERSLQSDHESLDEINQMRRRAEESAANRSHELMMLKVKLAEIQ